METKKMKTPITYYGGKQTLLKHIYAGYTIQDFEELLKLCSTLKGKFMLTMFPDKLLTEYIVNHGWTVVEVSRMISASRTNRRKQTELIVMNY